MLHILFLFLLSPVFAQERVHVKNVTPQGYIKTVEQVRIEFSQPMVRFGDIKLDFPAESSCFKNGQGRWIDTKNWVFDFDNSLPGGTSCSIQVMGKAYSFNTGGPHISEVFPRTYRPIDPLQNFILMLDSAAEKASLHKGAYFVVEGLGDRIPVEVIEGASAKKIKEAAQKEYQYEPESFKGDWLAIKAQRPFPAGSRVSLIWSKEVRSQSGFSSPSDEVFEFTVAEPFKAEFRCDRLAPGQPCIPLLNMNLIFSATISQENARAIYLQSSDGKKIPPSDLLKEGSGERVSYLTFKGPFPPNQEFKLYLPRNIKDEDGRELSNQSQFPLNVKTGENPSLLKFAADFGIVEAEPKSAIALTLRRVEKSLQTKFLGWTGKFNDKNFPALLKALNAVQKSPNGSERLSNLTGAEVKNIFVQKPLQASDTEVVGIPLKQNGFYVVEMESALLGQEILNKKAPYFVRSAALVTNMAVHVKYNQHETWVWVTDLKTAKVVPKATVKIYDVRGDEVARTTTDERGLAYITFKRNLDAWPKQDDGFYYDGFFAVAEKDSDFSFTHSSWNNGIESWRYQLVNGEETSGLLGHAILDRTLFKPEETLSAKILLRKAEGLGLLLPKANEWPSHIELTHASGLQSFKIPLEWSRETGTAQIRWQLPSGVKMGRWRMLLLKEQPRLELEVGEFSIESFRVPLIQVRLGAESPKFVAEKNIPLDISAVYFAGGAASNLPMKMRWSVEPSSFYSQDEDLLDYSFANGTVKEGVFSSGEDEGARYIPQSGVRDFTTDKQGYVRVNITNLKYSAGPQRLRAELEYKDPNGEIQSVIRSFSLWPSSIILGIKSKAWWASPSRVEFDVVALDMDQKEIGGQEVEVDLYTSRYYSHRKRLVGGFYSYEDFREYKKIGQLCRGVTNSNGIFNCSGKSSQTGSVLAIASTKDKQGRRSFANVSQWIVSPGERQWFGGNDNDRVDLIPFKKKYEPGEVAEFQLRTPFIDSKVLVTVERDTILYSAVVDVKGENPTIRIPIKKEFTPNVVVSAFAVRGRLNDPKPTALVDLGKPAFKLGMTQLKVGWADNTLKVNVETDRKKYPVKGKAQVTVYVNDSQGRPAKTGEVALVVVDEGLLELRENSSWDLLSAMMVPRPHKIETATAQSWLIGRRHFGLKALPIGGDGGGALRRELFDTLLYWNPKIKLDANGMAKVTIPLNDLTTSFRIVAIAQQGVDQFGTGWNSIQTSQEFMILPGIAGVAREGDQFNAGFVIRNTGEQARDLHLVLKTIPEIAGLAQQKYQLQSGESKEVKWRITAPQTENLSYTLTLKDSSGRILDEVKKNQKVLPLHTARVQQTQWGAWPEFSKLTVKQPQGAIGQKSSFIIEAHKNLGDVTNGVKEYWSHYEYSCLEQDISRAVSLNDRKLWKKIEQRLPAYIDTDGLLRYFPSSTSNSKGSVVLTAYVLAIAHESGLPLNEDSRSRFLDALSGYAQGQIKDESMQARADELLKKITVFEVLSRYRRLDLDWLTSVKVDLSELPTYTLAEWYQIHLREKNIAQKQMKTEEIEKELRNRFYFSAKSLQIKDERQQTFSWLMRNSDSALLRLILTTANLPQWKEDVPRLYQGSLARQRSGSWLLTTDNAWGVLAMKKVFQAYPSEKVDGVFRAIMNGKEVSSNWKDSVPTVFSIPWKSEMGTLEWKQVGSGKPWISVSVKAAVPVMQPVFAGFSVERVVTPIQQRKKGIWSVGDIAKVQLKVKSKTPQNWVAVEDPVPAGASILQSSWATAVERKEELVRFYFSAFSEKENMEYTIRFNQAGVFKVPSARVEAMYSPDLFAVLPEAHWTVEE